jgi:hypothetical protein
MALKNERFDLKPINNQNIDDGRTIDVEAKLVKRQYTWTELYILLNSSDEHEIRRIEDSKYKEDSDMVQPGLPRNKAY